MTTRIPMTPEGHKKLSAELRHLLTVERPAIIAAIATARAHGDLSENADYDAAKDKQSFIEGRIQLLTNQLAITEIINTEGLVSDQVQFGAYVTIIDHETDKKLQYQIVGDYESDIKENKISISSPLGRAVISRNKGEDIEVETPKGTKYYFIENVHY